mgnify:CR=1 FL=1
MARPDLRETPPARPSLVCVGECLGQLAAQQPLRGEAFPHPGEDGIDDRPPVLSNDRPRRAKIIKN